MTSVTVTVARVCRWLVLVLVGLVLAPGSATAVDQKFSSPPGRYMAFGDSITVGFGTSNRKTKSYPAQAGVRSYGVGGTTTIQAVEWWPAYIESHSKRPETAVFHIGINDVSGLGAPAEDVIHRLRKLRRIGRSYGIEVVFGTLTPSPAHSAWRGGERQRRIVNRWIRTQAKFVEYARALQCGRKQYLCPRFIGDKWGDVHPNNEGAKEMARVLRAWVKLDQQKG